jgi:hypothetical protein
MCSNKNSRISNLIESFNKKEMSKQRMQTSNYSNFDNFLTHIQLNQFGNYGVFHTNWSWVSSLKIYYQKSAGYALNIYGYNLLVCFQGCQLFLDPIGEKQAVAFLVDLARSSDNLCPLKVAG